MKKHRINWSLLVSLLALLVSIAALCVTKPRYPELGMDYQGWITGILALLVTALIGWNVYSVIDLKGMRVEIRELKERMEKQIKHANENTRLALSIDMIDSAPVLQAYSSNALPDSMIVMFNEFHKIENKESIGKILARSYITQNLIGLSLKEELFDKLIKELGSSVDIDVIEDFYLDFLSRRNDEHNPQQHDELKPILQRLLSETLQAHR